MQEELAATLKEPVSVYFDTNPHDGLLETHNVDKSLEGKLKCLIFIPIISQTYCAANSFAWQHEFCAFNKLAKENLFGRDIKLSNGNVASRILPVKIHELDTEDIDQLEKETGGVLRSIEFIYKSSGVNRPLRFNEDHPQDNLNKTYYLDQINKIANAIKEIIGGLKNPLSLKGIAAGKDSSNTSKNNSELLESIAVLPFANMSSDPEQEFFSDGISEEIINMLAQVPGLKVAGRTSSFSFKGKNQDLRLIGEQLNVNHILEGSVRKSGNKLRITAQLIKVEDGYHLWSERYDRELDDVFAIQDEIASNIAEYLKVTFFGNYETKEKRKPTTNMEAYVACLKGHHQYLKVTPDGMTRSIEYFEQAISLDSGYIDPYIELGDTYLTLATNGIQPSQVMMPMVRETANKALRINPSDRRAHALLACVEAAYDYDWNKADEQFGFSMCGVSQLPNIRIRYSSFYLLPLGLFEKAIDQEVKELESDPLNIVSRIIQCHHLNLAGHYDQAMEVAQKALEHDENHWFIHSVIPEILIGMGKYEEALNAAERSFRISPWDIRSLGMYAGLLARSGDTERAHQIRDQLYNMGMRNIGLLLYNLVLPDIEAAADCFQKAIELREPLAVIYSRSKLLAPLRSNKRWPLLAGMMNLPGHLTEVTGTG